MKPSPAALEAAIYGPATETLQGLLGAIEGFQWFPVHPDHSAQTRAAAFVSEHLAQLQALGLDVPAPDVTHTTWLRGPLEIFDRAAQGRYDPELWGDGWLQDHPWGAALGAAITRVRERIEQSPTLLARIRPPLWPRAGLINLVQPLLYNPPPPPELRAEPRWAMMDHVQTNLWRVFDWAVAFDGIVTDSPFHSLFQLHLLGYYPLGFEGRNFLVFIRSEVAA